MEDVLDVYARAHDPDIPVVCMDKKPYQLLDYTRDSIDATPGRVRKEDYEYSRKGVCSVFVWSQPLAGRRRVHARPRRTRVDWAHEIKTLLTVDYPDADKVVLVMDNLNTHTLGSLLRGVRRRAGTGPGQPTGDSLHTQARVLAQYRRDRIIRTVTSVPLPPDT